MKNIIKNSCAVLAVLTMLVSVIGTTCAVAFAYDDGSEIVLPLWEEDKEEDNSFNRS